MNLPFVRRRTYMRRFVELGQSYRRSIDEARNERDQARGQLQRWADSLAPRIHTDKDFVTGNVRILIEVEHRVLTGATQHEILAAMRDSIMRRLVDADRDYRGDMRQTEMQRLLRP